MAISDEIARVLVSQDPRRSADTLLGLLVEHVGADGAACFRIVGERLVLFAGRSVDHVALERVDSVWDDARDAVLEGRVYDAEDDFAVVPIARRAEVAGLLYVGAEHGFTRGHDALVHFVPLLRAALEAPQKGAQPAIETYVERTPAAQFQREQLLLLLDRHEWNIARVARAKDVSRVTIYEQMRRWGIERQKVVKGRHSRKIPLTS